VLRTEAQRLPVALALMEEMPLISFEHWTRYLQCFRQPTFGAPLKGSTGRGRVPLNPLRSSVVLRSDEAEGPDSTHRRVHGPPRQSEAAPKDGLARAGCFYGRL
jgi:hypothetical protein